MQPSLAIKLHDRIQFDNPFMLASGPPGTNGKVIAKSFDLGWGGVVIKTISLDSSKVINTAPRYGKLRSRDKGEVVGFENIELISDRPFETWLDELRQLKKNYPKQVLMASVMEEYRRQAWHESVRRVQEAGVAGGERTPACPSREWAASRPARTPRSSCCSARIPCRSAPARCCVGTRSSRN